MRGKWLYSGFGSVVTMILTAGAVIGACSAAGGTNGNGTDGAGAANSSGSGSGGDDGNIFGSGGSSGTTGSCAATVNKAEQVPLGMYLMIDKSGSMAGSNWTAVKTAITNFVDQPSAAGIGVGLQYFPLSNGLMCGLYCATDADCGPAACGPCELLPFPFPGLPPGTCGGGGGDSCDVTLYSKAAVVISPLPGIAGVIKSSLNNTSPTGGTPTSAALQGAIDYTKKWMTQNPTNVGVVVFATDGEPSSCQTDLSIINGIAKDGLDGVPSVKTFVIGVGNLASALDGIANAGGTGKAFLVDTNQNSADQFLQAMNAIRGAALSCAYLIPPAPAGEELDYGAINVQYTPENGAATLIPQVPSLAGCPADGYAWYYDNSTPPKQILLCPSTCNKISSDLKGQVDVLVGCKTVIK